MDQVSYLILAGISILVGGCALLLQWFLTKRKLKKVKENARVIQEKLDKKNKPVNHGDIYDGITPARSNVKVAWMNDRRKTNRDAGDIWSESFSK